MISIFYAKKGGGGYHDFSFKIFGLTVPKILLGNTSVYQIISGVEKFYASERRGGGGEYHVFPSKTFCHTVPKNFVGEHFGARKFRVSPSFMNKKRISQNFVESF